MKMISGAARSVVCRAGLAAAAVLALSAATQQRAEALSLASPVTVPAAKYASEGMMIEVRHGGGGGMGFRGGGGGFRGGGGFHGGGFRGGGMAFRGGGFRGGGMAFRGGGYRAAHIYRGGGYRSSRLRYGGFRHAYHRPHFRHRHFHRRFYYTPYYYHYPRRCRIVWTYWGPRKICRYRYWHRPYYWRYGW
jgi:hypothetical protein